MDFRNQKPTGHGGLRAKQVKTVSKRIVVWFALNGYIPVRLADYLIQHGGLAHE